MPAEGSQVVLQIAGLPSGALDAAAEFHRIWVPQARHELRGDTQSVVLILPTAPVDHQDWQRGAARDLGREFAPKRINLIAGGDVAAIGATTDYLAQAPGVTGQLLVMVGQTPENPA